MSETQTLDTTQQTAQPAQSQATPAPATTEESTLLGKKEGDASVSGEEKTLLGTKEGEKKEGQEQVSKAPEKYEFKAPEGADLDQAAIEKFSPVFKELDLTQEQAQKLVDAYAPYVKAQSEAQHQASIDYFKGIVKEWREQSIKDLGAEYNKEISTAAKAIDKANIPGLRELMEETGVGNHPAMVKFMIWAGKLVSQDNFPDSSMKKTPMETMEQKAKVLFPSMKE